MGSDDSLQLQDAYPLLDALFDLCTPTDFAQRYAPSTSSRNQGRSARLNELHVLLGAAMLRRTKAGRFASIQESRTLVKMFDADTPTFDNVHPVGERHKVEYIYS